MDIIGSRLKQRREEKGHSQETLAAAAGVSQSTISAIEDGTTKEPRTLPKIARALGTPVEFFTDEEYSSPVQEIHESESQPQGEKIRQHSSPTIPLENTKEHLSEVVEIDARGVAVKGVTGESSMTHVAVARWLLPSDFMRFELRTNPDRTIMVEILGDAMSPDFNPGDRAFIDTSQRNPAHSGLFAIEMDGATIVRRLELIPDTNPKQVRIKPKNIEHSTFVRALSELHIVGLVAGRFHRS